MSRLRELFRQQQNSRFFASAFAGVEAALEIVGRAECARFLPGGLPVRDWLAGSDDRPVPAAALGSVAEGVLLHLYQLCVLQPGPGNPLARAGGLRPVGAVGHSLGSYAAVFSALPVEGRREYAAAAGRSIAQVTVALLRCHQVAPAAPRPDGELLRRHAALGPGAGVPGAMAAVVGPRRPALDEAIGRSGDGPGGRVEIGLVNSPTFHVLTGGAEALMRLRLAEGGLFERPGTRWTYLGATAPFHSTVLASAMPLIGRDVDRNWQPVKGDGLTMPVYGTGTPANLQFSPHVLHEVAEQQMCRTFDWPAVVDAATADPAPDLVLDIGPGASAAALTRSRLRESGSAARFTSL
ncbi:ACP S-malonyltransferase [Kitasatospora phosalacinea]|uniref:ACP S-malonyltransferase n=1 Tax=Kitasatospora phosalacinea TaxID=2065 RepID=UPI0005267AB1|nr:ACP S-malonyltransferase [Kitasatospora phosalacinea]